MKFTVRYLTGEEARLLGRRVGLLWKLLYLMGMQAKFRDNSHEGG